MNITKEEAAKIVDQYLDERWVEIQNMDLPDTREFPVTEKELLNEVKNLQRVVKSDEINIPKSTKTRSNIVHHFCKSIDTANKHGNLSPVEYWEKLKTDKEEFRKFLINRLTRSDWYNEKKGANRHFIEECYVPPFIMAIGITTGMFANRVSYFKPSTAIQLVKKYAKNAESIVDPFCGYAARALGAVLNNKKFYGFDLNDVTIKENKEMYNWLSNSFPEYKGLAEFNVADAFNNTFFADCFLSCPPYQINRGKTLETIEEWQKSDGTKISCDKTQDEVIETCLKNYDCNTYIFVLDAQNTKYENYIKESFSNSNYINARGGKLTEASFNGESVFVFTRDDRDKILRSL